MCALAAELIGLCQSCCNDYRFIIFHTVILLHAQHMTIYGTIRHRIDHHLDD